MLLLECTTGALRLDKLANLVSRTEKLKKHLEMANFKDVTVIPILATTRPQDEVAPSIETAERQGVLVMCREQTDEWIQLSAASPDANAVFAKTVKLLRDIRQRYAQSHEGTVL